MPRSLHQFEPNECTHAPAALRPRSHWWSGTAQLLSSSSSSSSCCCVLHLSISFDSVSPWGQIQAFLQSRSLGFSSTVSPPFFEKRTRRARFTRHHKEGTLHPSSSFHPSIHQNWKRMRCAAVVCAAIITASLQKSHPSHALLTHFQSVCPGYAFSAWLQSFFLVILFIFNGQCSPPLPSPNPVWLMWIHRDISACWWWTSSCLMLQKHHSLCLGL